MAGSLFIKESKFETTRTVLGRLKSRKNVKWDVTDWSELGVSDAIGKLAGPEGQTPTIRHKPIKDKRLITWLVEAALISTGLSSIGLRAVIQTPSLFPLRLDLINVNELAVNERLESYRQGLDEDMIMLRGK